MLRPFFLNISSAELGLSFGSYGFAVGLGQWSLEIGDSHGKGLLRYGDQELVVHTVDALQVGFALAEHAGSGGWSSGQDCNVR